MHSQSIYDVVYSPNKDGDLAEYLIETYLGSPRSNLFYGSGYFFIIRDEGYIKPEQTLVRVGNSPAPDITYFVNEDFLLQSHGHGEINMSAMGAKKGIYNPEDALEDRLWSISNLDFQKLRDKIGI